MLRSMTGDSESPEGEAKVDVAGKLNPYVEEPREPSEHEREELVAALRSHRRAKP